MAGASAADRHAVVAQGSRVAADRGRPGVVFRAQAVGQQRRVECGLVGLADDERVAGRQPGVKAGDEGRLGGLLEPARRHLDRDARGEECDDRFRFASAARRRGLAERDGRRARGRGRAAGERRGGRSTSAARPPAPAVEACRLRRPRPAALRDATAGQQPDQDLLELTPCLAGVLRALPRVLDQEPLDPVGDSRVDLRPQRLHRRDRLVGLAQQDLDRIRRSRGTGRCR